MNDDADGQKSQQQNIENKDAAAGGIKWDAPSDAYYQIKNRHNEIAMTLNVEFLKNSLPSSINNDVIVEES